jgi:hypothetical protein
VKLLLALAILVTVPTLIAPPCVVVHDGVCFESQRAYDIHMGWGPEQQRREAEANR